MTEVKKILIVIANDGFQDHEFGVSFSAFNDAGFDITIAAGKKGECVGVFGTKTMADVDIFFTDASKYDMTVFIGGGGAYSQYFHDEEYLRLARTSNKIGAICLAPMIISESGVLNGKTVTGWDNGGVQKSFIEKNGGIWSDDSVVVCGNIVTGNGPDSAEEFAKKCVDVVNNE